MASLFFFHFSKREKKASSLFIARLRFTAHASASKHTRVSLRWLSRARSFVRSIAREFASRSILARVFVRGLARSLARLHDSPNPKVHAMVHFRRLAHETRSERMRPQARWLGQHACIHTQSWTRT